MYFHCPSPDFTTSIVSQSVTNNCCAPSCGGHKRKVRGHIKKFSTGASRRHSAAHLQIASDATASIIQGSAIGPASYVVHAADLRAARSGNCVIKYADGTRDLIPACNVESRQQKQNYLYASPAWWVGVCLSSRPTTSGSTSTPRCTIRIVPGYS